MILTPLLKLYFFAIVSMVCAGKDFLALVSPDVRVRVRVIVVVVRQPDSGRNPDNPQHTTCIVLLL